MIPFALAVSLLLAPAAESAAPAPPDTPVAAAPAAQPPAPVGAPTDDYQFVAWCYGVLDGYLSMHDEVMPEVTRIESTWRRPGSKLADDLKVYDAQQRQGREDLKRFRAALTAAEKASLRPINVEGAAAVARGRAVWNAAPDVTTARKAQEWMSWSLPAKCPVTAATLEKRAKLFGASLQANREDEPQPTPDKAPAETAPAAETAPPSGNSVPAPAETKAP